MKHYVVIDLEMCKIPKARRTKKYHWASETIQIGAVALNEAYQVVKEFSMYVAPRYGHLTSEIIKLTGITPENLKDAPDIAQALESFREWLPENPVFVSWSESDRYQLQYEIVGKDLCDADSSLLEQTWMDCQRLFDEKIHAANPSNLTNALNLADINYRDGIHDGLTDAYNTALLFAKLMTSEVFSFNPYYQRILTPETQPQHLSVSMGSLFEGIKLSAAG